MSDPVLLALISSVPVTIASVATLIVALRQAKKLEEVRHATNSLTDRLVAAALIEGHAGGVREERDRKEGKTP